MKKNMLAALLVAYSLTGCVSWPQDAHPPAGSAHALAALAPLPDGPITADQVEATNAHRVAEAIWDEMDQEQTKDIPAVKNKEAKKR